MPAYSNIKKKIKRAPKIIKSYLFPQTERGTVDIYLSKGFGNNLFQYCFGRLLAETYNLKLNHKGIPELNIPAEKKSYNYKLPIIEIKKGLHNDTVYHKYFDKNPERANYNYYLEGYFEDYTLYKPHLEKIRSWFPDIPKTNTEDLVLHLRLQNRLLQAGHHLSHITGEAYCRIIRKFKFKHLHIVSDVKKWDYIKRKDVERIKEETFRAGFITKNPILVPPNETIKYMNELIDSFKEFNPIFHHSENYIDDFNFIRSFDKIIVMGSTFSWWAATLSHASQIGVFKPWRARKEKKRNKNLGETNFPGWFQWGSRDDLRIKDKDLQKKIKEWNLKY